MDEVTAAVVKVLADHFLWDDVCWRADGTMCEFIPNDAHEWREHVAPLIVAAVRRAGIESI
jgi:hypothetical protein